MVAFSYQPLICVCVCVCRPGEKIGVVGRTGAGKSTLIIAMFRLSELNEGSITIDGIRHNSLALQQLRSKIAIIPQEPVMFKGTLRSNLDPFHNYSDAQLIEVLKAFAVPNSWFRAHVTQHRAPLARIVKLLDWLKVALEKALPAVEG